MGGHLREAEIKLSVTGTGRWQEFVNTELVWEFKKRAFVKATIRGAAFLRERLLGEFQVTLEGQHQV